MKVVMLLCLTTVFLTSLLLAQPPLTVNPSRAQLKIDIDRQKGAINSLLYGSFVEHLGRSAYGGVYDPTSRQADAFGFRKDVALATRQLGVTHLRWPGSNFVSGFIATATNLHRLSTG